MDIKGLAWNETLSKRFNNSRFPKSVRGLIVCKSASGKKALLLNFLLRPGWLGTCSEKACFNLNIVFSKRLSKNTFPKKL